MNTLGCHDILGAIMALFGGKKEESFSGLLGVDLGTAGIKMVELVPEKGRIRLSTYGYAEPKLPVSGAKSPIDDIPKTVAVMKRIMKEGNFKATRAVAALPTTKVFHAIISLPVPKSPKEDLRPMIENQAQKLLPLPLSEMVLDSNVLDKHLLPNEEKADAATTEGKYMRVLLTGAPKTLIASYVELFKQANLELVSLETEIFALTRSLVGKEKSHVLIVDLGAERTNLAIVDNGVPLLTRVIKSGGSNITQALAGAMGMGFEEGESMKRDLSFAKAGAMPGPLAEALKPTVHEIRYALQLYAEQVGNRGVEKILLTGGSSRLPGLSELLTRELNMNVYLGDPWARVAFTPDLRGVLDEIGPRYAVAVGLAERLEEKS
jgi:type IV pilus assembly protein PilM